MPYDFEQLRARFERAESIVALVLCVEEAKTAPEADKVKLRSVYRMRLAALGYGRPPIFEEDADAVDSVHS